MKAAFYKGRKKGLVGIFDVAVHHWEDGPYAHVELMFADGSCASATYLDKGVRFANTPTSAVVVDFTDPDWDFIDLPGFDEVTAKQWFVDHDNAKYDTAGDAHFVIGFIKHDPTEFFCSESVAAALGIQDPWRLDPNALYVVLKWVTSLKATA